MEIRPDEFLTFSEWLANALVFGGIALAGVIIFAVFAAYLVSAVRYGPVEGFYAVARTLFVAVGRELPHTSWRRIWAIARLAVQEALRRKILLVAFALFALIMLLAGWFLDVDNPDPAHVYLSFVLTMTNLMALALALLLSIFSLPNDIKSRTIYTVVTKPVRAGEIVFGRILGFAMVGTLLLAVSCVASYLFVKRGLRHGHSIDPAVAERTDHGYEGQTTRNAFHRHRFAVDESGGRTERAMGHYHEIRVIGQGDDVRFEVGPALGMLEARVPVYGQLRFLDRKGNDTAKGVSVGKEWEYRSYVEGRTLSTAIWRFRGLRAEDYPNGIPLNLTLSVFRTQKGDIEKTVRGRLYIKHPTKRLQSAPLYFNSQEFETQTLDIPLQLDPLTSAGTARPLSLFGDLIDPETGGVEIWLRCDEPGQYFGVAQGDAYIMAANAAFSSNFIKGYIGIWLQMLLVISFGVMFSTVLSSPVALLATVSTIMLCFVGQFVAGLYSGKTPGGGAFESALRLTTQNNMLSELGVSRVAEGAIKGTDKGLVFALNCVTTVLPKFDVLGRPAVYVANNFNVQSSLMARITLATLIYVATIAVVGYFLLKTREIAA